MRTRNRTLTIICLAGLLLSSNMIAAQARSEISGFLPERPADSLMALIGASDQGVVVQRSPESDFTGSSLGRIFSGPEGTELVHRSQITPEDCCRTSVTGVAGSTLAWQEGISDGNNFLVHRMNLRTGKDMLDADAVSAGIQRSRMVDRCLRAVSAAVSTARAQAVLERRKTRTLRRFHEAHRRGDRSSRRRRDRRGPGPGRSRHLHTVRRP